MLTQVLSAAVQGIEAFQVRVEVNVAPGLPAFAVVGLPQGAVREGRERVTAAIRNAGLEIPLRRITVNLAPADVRKDGSALDLPIAVGLLCCSEEPAADALQRHAFIGELGLDGTLRPVRGALSVASLCQARGIDALVLPASNAAEAAAVEGVDVLGAETLWDVWEHLRGVARLRSARPAHPSAGPAPVPDLSEVRGQGGAKRALEIAAAGGHNVLLLGPPGSGKTMLARRLPGILPPLTRDEALESTRIHSVAGLLTPEAPLLASRPFRAPHHTVSDAGLVGGGSALTPGEACLAHAGVLFLDELPEFRRHVLDVLRQPLESGFVTLSRASGTVRYPSRFLLVAAMNPCPCGYHGDDSGRCTCDPPLVRRYRGRVSGPLLDRIDLHVEVPRVPFEALDGDHEEEPSDRVRERVLDARARQAERFGADPGLRANAGMGPAAVRRLRVGRSVAALLQNALDRLGFSARAYHRAIKIARTIADLEGAAEIEVRHAAEAIQYRALDRGAPVYSRPGAGVTPRR